MRGKTNILAQETRPAPDSGPACLAQGGLQPGNGRRRVRSWGTPRPGGPRTPRHALAKPTDLFMGNVLKNVLICVQLFCVKHFWEGENRSQPLAPVGCTQSKVYRQLSQPWGWCGSLKPQIRFSQCVMRTENYQYLSLPDSFNLPVFVKTF